jgi:3-hydroxymyristoyl/3-hydroxydecanoyl-(acyl carrier protein) dehydratase
MASTEQWNLVQYSGFTGSDEISVTARVEENSLWFSGHFPGNPILPGIAQLAMILEVIQKTVQDNLRISEIRRVRFKQIVKPGDELTVVVKPVSENSYSFRIMLKDEIACSGSLTTVTADAV